MLSSLLLSVLYICESSSLCTINRGCLLGLSVTRQADSRAGSRQQPPGKQYTASDEVPVEIWVSDGRVLRFIVERRGASQIKVVFKNVHRKAGIVFKSFYSAVKNKCLENSSIIVNEFNSRNLENKIPCQAYPVKHV